MARAPVFLVTFAVGLIVRTWGITRDFWLLGDQIRDWSIALRPLTELPLEGGPAFYGGLWVIRVTVGPWFDNLPHAAAIGLAIVQSGADVLLVAAIWRRFGSPWIALATIALVAAASHDLSRSAVVQSSMMGLAFAKIATALVLLDAPRRSPTVASAAAAFAWCAVQCDPNAIVVATGVLAALIAAPVVAGDRDTLVRNLWIAAIVVAVLQVPHAVSPASKSFAVYHLSPSIALWLAWILVVCIAVVTVKVKPLPQILAGGGLVLLIAVLASAPPGTGLAATHRMPEYGVLVDGSRKIAKRAEPMQAIRADFQLPPSTNSEFLYRILGGRIDPASPWIGVIKRDGQVSYERVSPGR